MTRKIVLPPCEHHIHWWGCGGGQNYHLEHLEPSWVDVSNLNHLVVGGRPSDFGKVLARHET